MGIAKKPRTSKPALPDPIVSELVGLIRESQTQQAEVLKVALEGQRAVADVLNKWMAMFVPSATPIKSTTEEEREIMRQELAEAEWDPINVFSTTDMIPKDFN